MGSAPSLELSIADSTLTPGESVVLSEPIEHDYDIFMDEAVAYLKYPVLPHQELVLKECKVVEEGDTASVKVILDGSKLAKFGFGNKDDPTLDRVESACEIQVDRAARKVVTKQFAPCWMGEKEELLFTGHVDMLSNPLRLEYFWVLPDGTRKADDYVLKVLQPIVNAIIGMLADRKVPVKFNAAKPSVVSQPVEEDLCGYEALFDAIVAVLQQFPPQIPPSAEEISETKVKLVYRGELAPEGLLSWDKDAGAITLELTSTTNNETATTTNRYSLSKEPVVLEAQCFDAEGKNITSLGTARMVQGVLDASVAQASSGSWFGMF